MDEQRASADEARTGRSEERHEEESKPAAVVYDLSEWRRKRALRGRQGQGTGRRGPGGRYGGYFTYGYYGSYYTGYYGGYRPGRRERVGHGTASHRRQEAMAAYRRAGGFSASAKRVRGSGPKARRSVVATLPGVRAQIKRRRRRWLVGLALCVAVAAALFVRASAAPDWDPLGDPPLVDPPRPLPVRLASLGEGETAAAAAAVGASGDSSRTRVAAGTLFLHR